MPKLSLAKLERHLYSAADRLRQSILKHVFTGKFIKQFSANFTKREL